MQQAVGARRKVWFLMPGQYYLACSKPVYAPGNGSERGQFKGYCNQPRRHKGKCSL